MSTDVGEIEDDYTLEDCTFVSKEKTFETEVGDKKEPTDFYPQIKIKRWENEANFSLRLLGMSAATPTIDGDKIIFSEPGLTARFYALGWGEGGEYEFEIEMAAKPAGHTIDFSYRAKGERLLYQGALTQQEIDEGHTRPDNVVGSYAVYHGADKKNNQYKTGKLFHLYAPYLIDANEVRTKCSWSLDEGRQELSVSPPAGYWDSATYPVILDPTFGYESAGGTKGNVKNTIRGSWFTAPENGTLDSITAFCHVTGGARLYLMSVYEYQGDGDPGALLDTGEQTLVPGASNAWQTFNPGAAYAFTGGSKYFFCGLSTGDTGGGNIKYDAETDKGFFKSSVFPTLPDPITGETLTSENLSIYATYTATEQVHNLVAADAVATPALDGTALTQVHALTAADAAATPAVDGAALAQVHALTAADAAATPAVDGAALTQVHALAAADAAATPALDGAALTQVHALAAADAAATPEAESGAISTGSFLVAEDATAMPAFDTGAINQVHALALDDMVATPEAESGAISTGPFLVAEDATATPAFDTGAINQVHALALDDMVAIPEAESGAISTGPFLVAEDATLTPTFDTGAINQVHALAAADAVGQSVSDAGAIGQIHALVAADATAQPVADSGAVSQVHALVGVDAESTGFIETVALVTMVIGKILNPIWKSVTPIHDWRPVTPERSITILSVS